MLSTVAAFVGLCAVPSTAGAVTKEEYQALVDLYLATGGEGSWVYTEWWLVQDAPDDYDAPCTKPWAGVDCDLVDNVWLITRMSLGPGLSGGIPESFGALQSLVELDLGGNEITQIPSSFGALGNLEVLNLAGNLLQDIPGSFADLHALSLLRLDSNHFGHLPDAIGKLDSLYVLDISDNQIKTLPDLGALALDEFSLRGNRLGGDIEGVISPPLLARFMGEPQNRRLHFHWNALYAEPGIQEALESMFAPCCTQDFLNFPSQTLAPGGVTASSVGDTHVTISWNATDTDPKRDGGYHLYLSTDGGESYGDLPVVTVVGKEKASAALSSLEPETAYVVRVESYTQPHSEDPGYGEPDLFHNFNLVVSDGNRDGDNLAEFVTLSLQVAGSASTGGAPSDSNGCACRVEQSRYFDTFLLLFVLACSSVRAIAPNGGRRQHRR
ncbi:MAG: leucine-rich repeat domain-containing protein [Myxococcales bacterium]|nr:leucine-rich repeat domain-containing protein [Myxococcales bacterium]